MCQDCHFENLTTPLHIPCMAHRLQTVGKELERHFYDLLRFVEHFSLAVMSNIHFGRGQRLRQRASGLKLVASWTRWSSSFETVDSMLQHWESIARFLHDERQHDQSSAIHGLWETMRDEGQSLRKQAQAFTEVGREVWSAIGIVEGPDPLQVWPTVMQLRGTLTVMSQSDRAPDLVKEAAKAACAKLTDERIWQDFNYACELQVLHPERKKGVRTFTKHTHTASHTASHVTHAQSPHPYIAANLAVDLCL